MFASWRPFLHLGIFIFKIFTVALLQTGNCFYMRVLVFMCAYRNDRKEKVVNKIVFENTKKTYDKKTTVIENLNLSIDEGSFTVLLGPSGCGKSTTLRMIAGLEDLSGGTLKINGKDMKDIEPGDREIAMVFQNYAIYPTMSVRENIEFGLKNAKVPKEERKRRIEEIGKITGLTDYMERKPSALSGGQRQRVALARAMVKNPEIFLMDEPLSNLDAKLRSQLRTELIELYQKLGATFVYVTHDQVEAMSMGTNIVLMNEGNIMQQGRPDQIYRDPDNVFTAKFIGTPPMNILPIDVCPKDWNIPENVYFVGFRPEDISFIDKGLDCVTMLGNVMTREMLGAEVLYKLNTESGTIQARDYHTSEVRREQVKLWISREKLYFFDKNENRIRM